MLKYRENGKSLKDKLSVRRVSMQKVINLYNLKPGANMDEFKKWSREVDQKTVPRQEGVRSFEVIEIKASEKEDFSYQIAEIIDVDRYEMWQKALKTEEMKKVVQQWRKWGDESSVITFYGDLV